MTFLINLGVTEISCSFRLVLKGKTGREMSKPSRLEFLEKFSANNLALSDTEENTSELLNRQGIADLALLGTSNSPKVPRVKFLRNDSLILFA